MFNGHLVRSLREERGLSTNALAKELGLSRSYISMIELGQKRPAQDRQEKIAAFFKQPVEKFMSEMNDAARQADLPIIGLTPSQMAPPTSYAGPLPANDDSLLTPMMVLGMIHGILHEVSQSVRDGLPNRPSRSLLGKTPLGSYHIVSTTELVVLHLDSPENLEDWTSSGVKMGRMPAVITLTHSETTQNAEIVWFTEYVSVYFKILQLRRWKDQGKKLESIEPSLQGYL